MVLLQLISRVFALPRVLLQLISRVFALPRVLLQLISRVFALPRLNEYLLYLEIEESVCVDCTVVFGPRSLFQATYI